MLFLGVDGGKSSTTALIADESGRVLGMGSGGPSNHVSGEEARRRFLEAIGAAVGGACRQASLDPAGVLFRAACLGFSGEANDKRDLVEEAIRAESFSMTNDAVIALAGATAGAPGIITIAGTGSISLGRNSGGHVARSGGWGYIFGDEGGAFDITRQALRAILRREEGWGPETALLPMLLSETGSANANELMHRMYTPEFPRQRTAALSRLVDRAARGGDAVAIDILHRAAQDLAVITGAVRGQLFEEGEALRIAYIGGVFRSDLLRSRFAELATLHEGVHVGPPMYGPAAGALLEAFRSAGLAVKLADVPAEKR